jgi:glutathione S-transferase
MNSLTVIGNYISPYVRKVLVCLELKGLPYEIDPITPFVGDDRFTALNPLRRVPILIDGDLVLNDSSVICQYLEDKYPAVSIYPVDIVDRARARWLEEYADTHLANVLIWRLFYQLGIKRYVFRETTDEAVVAKAREVDIPAALDYLEGFLPAEGYLYGELSIADISVASYFRTASFVRYAIDAARWPRAAAFVSRVLALASFQKLARYEDAMLRLPLGEQRAVLAQMGAPLTAESMGSDVARHGVGRSD